jgi:L-alanine-DL-glutamate epimerase-like enolase superfamily enzyme
MPPDSAAAATDRSAAAPPTALRDRALAIQRVEASAYTIPTDRPESDGTFQWNATTIVVAHVKTKDAFGLGFTYAAAAAVPVIRDVLAPVVVSRNAMEIPRTHQEMARACRNIGRPGIASYAISAVDIALWDLKARLLGVSLAVLLGDARDAVPLYGSGGFTSYSIDELREQLGGWARAGIAAVKMKVGRDARADIDRVREARDAVGAGVQLFVDANGAYSRKQALAQADTFAHERVSWFEEPVSSDDLPGLRLLRDRAPAGMDIAAGEYGFDAMYFRRMLAAGAVDVLQADATRCGGITGFLSAGALCDGWGLPLSAHTAPSVHAHVCCAVGRVRHLEYFHDHVRIERMLFDGVLEPESGELRPDRSRPGLGLTFRADDAAQFAA